MSELSANAASLNPGRRLVMFGFAFWLVSLGGWWFWPRGDSRFVGRWAVSDAWTLPQLREMELFPNGSSRNWILTPSRSIVGASRWEWAVRDGVIEFTWLSPPGGKTTELVELVRSLRRKVSGTSSSSTRMRILEVTEDRIRLLTMPIQTGSQPQELVLTRMRG